MGNATQKESKFSVSQANAAAVVLRNWLRKCNLSDNEINVFQKHVGSLITEYCLYDEISFESKYCGENIKITENKFTVTIERINPDIKPGNAICLSQNELSFYKHKNNKQNYRGYQFKILQVNQGTYGFGGVEFGFMDIDFKNDSAKNIDLNRYVNDR